MHGFDILPGHNAFVEIVSDMISDRDAMFFIEIVSDMISEAMFVGRLSFVEPQVALVAFVRQFPGVDCDVLLEFTRISESSVALRAVVV